MSAVYDNSEQIKDLQKNLTNFITVRQQAAFQSHGKNYNIHYLGSAAVQQQLRQHCKNNGER